MSRRCVGVFSLLLAFLVQSLIPGVCPGEDIGSSNQAEKLLKIGTVGPRPINLTVWTNKTTGESFKEGDSVVVYFKADQDCYVTALNVSVPGDVAVWFPSKEHPDNFVKAGVQYSLFDDKSRIRLEMRKDLPRVNAVFYVTSKPVSLDMLSIPDRERIIQIPHTDKKSLDILACKIEKASASERFNRVAFSVKSETSEGPKLKLMGPPLKARPSAPESEPPESLTGTQGVKPAVK